MRVDVFVDEVTFVGLIVNFANGTEMKAECRFDGTNPELYEGRVFWIDAEIAALDVGNSSDDVVALVNGEVVETSCDGGPKDCAEDEKN